MSRSLFLICLWGSLVAIAYGLLSLVSCLRGGTWSICGPACLLVGVPGLWMAIQDWREGRLK